MMSEPIQSNSNTKPLTILHTSDWHLGRRLYGQMRYDEFEAFLGWLDNTISQYKVDVLIVAGDIFDTMTPSNRAQALYYEFLGSVSKSCCQHIVIVAGNHDSPTFLDAPSNVLKFLNVHVIGTACENLQDEVLTLTNKDGNPYCIVTAVPYLRDRDVRNSHAGESADDKDAKVISGIKSHYDSVADIAKAKQAQLTKQLGKKFKRHIPIIATGHLFAAGGRTTEDDGVRDLYVGSLGKVSADLFDDCFDYVALGHLHVPQKVGGCEHIRYSGSPIPMGFGEARQQKQVLLIQFGGSHLSSSHFSHSHLNVPPTKLANSTSVISNNPKPHLSQDNIPKSKQPKQAESHPYMDDLFARLDEDEIDNQTSDSHLTLNIESVEETHSEEASTFSNDSYSDIEVVYHDTAKQMQVVKIPVPCLQKFEQITGDMAHIEHTIQTLPKTEPIWLEVIYNGDAIVSDLRDQVQALIDDTLFKVLKIKNTSVYNRVLKSEGTNETLQDLNETEVFERCMTVHNIADTQKNELRDAYSQILYDIHHDDKMAE